MEAIAVFVAATGLSLFAFVVIACSLCRSALRDGGDFEAEMRALSLTLRVRASRSGGRAELLELREAHFQHAGSEARQVLTRAD